MCGIFGVIVGNGAQYPSGLSAFFQEAALCGTLRGDDSTGMFQIDREGTCFVHKAAVDGPAFIRTKRFNKLATKTSSAFATVGHHRMATHGAVIDENAHPFTYKNEQGEYLTGVHNGVVYANMKNHDVDSDWLFEQLWQRGDEGYASIHGSYALAYYDSRKKAMVLSANGGRSLFFATLKNHDAVVFASELGMLSWLAQRNMVTLDDFHNVEANKMYEFTAESPKAYTTKDIPAPAWTYASYKSQYQRQWDEDDYDWEWDQATNSLKKKAGTAAAPGATEATRNVPATEIMPYMSKYFGRGIKAHEIRLSRLLEIHGREVAFTINNFRPEQNELFGWCKVVQEGQNANDADNDNTAEFVDAVIPGVTADEYKRLASARLIVAKIVAARPTVQYESLEEVSEQDIALVLDFPHSTTWGTVPSGVARLTPPANE